MQLSKYIFTNNATLILRNISSRLVNPSLFSAYSTNVNQEADKNNNKASSETTAITTKINDTAAANADNNELDELYKRVVIQVQGHEDAVLNSYAKFVSLTCMHLKCEIKVNVAPARFIERWTLLKSRFGNRKHMRQYEMRTHYRKFTLFYLTGSTCDTILEYIQRNIPEGVAMHVHKTRMERLPESFQKQEDNLS